MVTDESSAMEHAGFRPKLVQGSDKNIKITRPEDLELAEDGNGNGNLTVRLVEQLGADTLVHGFFGENRTDMTIRLGGIQNFNSGEVLPVRVAADKIHLFDPDTEKRL